VRPIEPPGKDGEEKLIKKSKLVYGHFQIY
jgi:hypothetical protein